MQIKKSGKKTPVGGLVTMGLQVTANPTSQGQIQQDQLVMHRLPNHSSTTDATSHQFIDMVV